MASYTRSLTIPPNGLLNPEALRDEFDRIAVAHNANNRVIEGKANHVFSAGFQVSYDASENAYGKYISVSDTGNADDHPSYGPITESSTTHQLIQIADACIACEGVGNVALAKAFRFGVTINPGAGVANIRQVTHPAAGVAANEIILRDNSFTLADDDSLGQHIFAPANGVTRQLDSLGNHYAEIDIRNTETSSPYLIQLRIGANAGGDTGADLFLSLRLLGYYV